ncbi:MAG: PHP domain-containing protein [Candidatus Cloacimonetes bacterium]|nr:PHP domain-containing protein [Candidatus Cloacimonadota bacterium]
MKKIDLHIHSNFSDGTKHPRDIIKETKEQGFDVISITDHDTLDGYQVGKRFARRMNIELVPGVEISSYFQSFDVHILAYFVDVHNRQLVNMLKYLQKGRILRAQKILDKLDEYGIRLKLKDVFEHVENKKVVGRPHIATAMAEKEYTTYEEAFWHYIGNDRPAYVRKPTFPPEEVIKIIKEAGGIAILAHPGVIKNDFIIADLVDFGLDGLEVFYPLHSQYQRQNYIELAERYGLLMTGGSDYHGFARKNEEYGQALLKENYFNQILDYRKTKHAH